MNENFPLPEEIFNRPQNPAVDTDKVVQPNEAEANVEKKLPEITVENATSGIAKIAKEKTTEYFLNLFDGLVRVGFDSISYHVNLLPFLPGLPSMKDELLSEETVRAFVLAHLEEIIHSPTLSRQGFKLEREAESDPSALFFSTNESRQLRAETIEKEIKAVMQQLKEKAVVAGNVASFEIGTHLARLPEYVREELVARAKQSGYSEVRISSLPNRGYGGNGVLKIEFVR